MVEMKITVEGTADLLKKLSKSPKVLEKWQLAAITKSVLDVRALSQKYTPVDTGNLRGSIRTKVTKTRGPSFRGEIWYTASYAMAVHEMTWTKLRNGRHKFLEHALYASTTKIKKNYVSALKRGLREAFK